MLLIKCNIIGSVEFSRLKFTLKGGDIIDLHSIFTPSEIKRETNPPDGCIYQAYQNNWISDIRPNSIEHKEYLRRLEYEKEEKIKLEVENNERKILLEYFKKDKPNRIKLIESFNYSYYDILLSIQKKEQDYDILYVIFKKLSEFSDRKVEEGFILISLNYIKTKPSSTF
ncbi:MAG: hypothetical protein ACFFG0_42230, partial [Candidatus Thorarchaeota archaeon]